MFTAPHRFEPLLPTDARIEPLLAKAHDLSRAATSPQTPSWLPNSAWAGCIRSSMAGDLDGPGNLSEQALIVWADYVLDVCQDQVGFMASTLDFQTLKERIEACLVFEATAEKSGVRQESLRGLHYLFLSGDEMARGDFKARGCGRRPRPTRRPSNFLPTYPINSKLRPFA